MSNILSSVTFNICNYPCDHHLDHDEASITPTTKPDKDILSIDPHILNKRVTNKNTIRNSNTSRRVIRKAKLV